MTEDSKDWVLATHNSGKAREIRALFGKLPVRLTSAKELELPEPEETGTTFEANAELKALAAAQATGRIALADDSGVAVHALGGEPGIHTARWAGEARDFDLARRRVQAELREPPGQLPLRPRRRLARRARAHVPRRNARHPGLADSR